MGKSQTPPGTTERINLDPATLSQIQQQIPQFLSGSQGYSQMAQQAAGQVGTNFNQFAPTLETGFAGLNPNLRTTFQSSGELDPLARATLSQASQAANSQLSAQQNNINQQFRGQPGVSNILNQQARFQSQLNQNPLLFQATQQMNERQQMNQQLENQAKLLQSQQLASLFGLGNQAQLQQSQARAGLQQAGNEALGQQLNFGAQVPNAQQNILSVLGALGSLLGSRTSEVFDANQVAANKAADANLR